MRTIRCYYSCALCGIEERPVDVPSRDPSGDIREWVGHTVANAIYVDHSAASPACTAEKISRIRIPTQRGRPIGVSDGIAPLPN